MCIRDSGNTLYYVSHRRKRMNRADDKPVQFGIVRDQTNPFAISLRHKKAGEHHSVGASQGVIIPEAMYFAISALAGS